MSPSFTGEYYLGDSDEIFATAVQGDQNPTRAATTEVYNNVSNEVDTNVALAQLGGTDFGGGSVNRFSAGTRLIAGSAGATGANASGPYNRVSTGTIFNVEDVSSNYKVAPVFYVDQILPFDIAIVAANEYGQSAQMRLYGCEILNEGSGFSIDDIVIENQMTYVCRTILPWRSIDLKVSSANSEETKNARESLYGKLVSTANRGANGAFQYRNLSSTQREE
jgi:hypothetical protein